MQPFRVINRVVTDGGLAFFVGRSRDVKDVHEYVGMAQVIEKLIAQSRPLVSGNRKKGMGEGENVKINTVGYALLFI